MTETRPSSESDDQLVASLPPQRARVAHTLFGFVEIEASICKANAIPRTSAVNAKFGRSDDRIRASITRGFRVLDGVCVARPERRNSA